MKKAKERTCPVCGIGSLEAGHTTLTFEPGGAVIVVQRVPARVCSNCGEDFVAEDIGRKVYALAQDAVDRGVRFDVRIYKSGNIPEAA